MLLRQLYHLPNIPLRHAPILSDHYQTLRFTHLDDCLRSCFEDMHMRRFVIGGVDSESVTSNPKTVGMAK